MADVLVLSPSFGKFSKRPFELMESLGHTPRSPSVPSPLTSAQLQAEIGDAEALIVGLDHVDAAAIAAGPRLKAIAKHGVGVDNIDVAAASARGITVLNTPGANRSAVADLVFGLLLAVTRNIVKAHESVTAGKWENFHGPELGGKTIGIVGFGRIGQEVARRAHGFGMKVLAYDPYLEPQVFFEAAAEHCHDLDDLIERSNVVTLHLPGSGEVLLDSDRLARLPRGAVVVNAARGDLVDEHAVRAALDSGQLGGYAADAFAHEPPTGSPLLGAPHSVFTPHIGAFTDRANEIMGTLVVDGIAAVLDGREPAHPVKP